MLVKHKPFREYFFTRESGPERSLITQTDVSVYDARRYLANPGSFAIYLAVMLLVLTFFSRMAFLLLLTEAAVLACLFAFALFHAKQLTLKRVFPLRPLRELDSVEVVLEIKNHTNMALGGIVVEDRFEMAKDSRVRLAPDVLNAKSMSRMVYKRTCDGGMGKHKVGPLTARVSDPLGIFEFRITDEEIREFDVYPKIDRLPLVPVRPSVEGFKYGNYEVASRGLSVNFSGVRSYERGDSLRHIAWRLSARGQGLMVKEFEKVVSCDVSVVLNLAPQWQIGKHSESTWEYCKDIALSVIQQQLELGNTVGFFSDRSYIEPAAGSDHFHLLARHISSLKPASEAGMRITPEPILAKYHDFFSRGSNVMYITPFNLAEIKQSGSWMKRLTAEHFQVICVLVDTNMFWLRFLESISTGILIGAKLMQGLDEIAADFKQHGIQTYIARKKVPLKEVFR